MVIPSTMVMDVVPSAAQWSGFQTVILMVGVPVLSMIATIVAIIWRDRKREVSIQNQPVIVAMQKEFTSQTEFHRHVEENKRAHEQFDVRIGGVDRKGKQHLDDKLDAMRKEREDSSRRMHGEVSELRVKVGQLEIETKNQTAQLNRIDQKLDGIREKMT